MNDYSALIVITTCNRINLVKQNIWEYLKFTNSNDRFDFLLAVDGINNDYLDFTEKYDIPMIHSEQREGVGLSKNRVLTKFSDYDYYFFIEDDVYLENTEIFDLYISTSNKENIPHMMAYGSTNITEVLKQDNYTLVCSQFGGAQFNFFTKDGLKKVGGWHTLFAKYKRFGHTEHSYRFFHQELQRSPFIAIKEAQNSIIVFDPPHVSQINTKLELDENGLCKEERNLINENSTYFPLKTLSPFYFNDKNLGFNQRAFDFLNQNSKIYPLSSGKERRKILGEYFALKISMSASFLTKISLITKSFLMYPMNNPLKHYIKTKLIGRKR
tara:strand:- start:55465 stop:56445 length:981 start_codon:yes stop_codon:yes gene_type:complete